MSSSSTTLRNEYDAASVLVAVATGLAFGYAAVLLMLLFHRNWILTSGGIPMPSDFLVYRAAGIAAMHGTPALVYDPHAFHLLQITLTKPFPNYFYWNYPPSFFFVAVFLARLPYVPAFLLWVGTTGSACAITIGRIALRRDAMVTALASPIFLLATYVGQNGFLSAALMGAFLLSLRERPLIAGLLLALMTYKPQFGLLLPLALLAGGHWRAICWAIVATAILTIASALAFGLDSYTAFLGSLAVASKGVLTLGGEGWAKIESMYSVARFLGAGDHAAWLLQIVISAVAGVGVLWLWHGDSAYELKAAGLVAATMLSIPYLHEYDFPIILVAFSFLYRDRRFDRVDWLAVGAANLLMAAFLLQLAPLGPVVAAIPAAMVLGRVVSRPRANRQAALGCAK